MNIIYQNCLLRELTRVCCHKLPLPMRVCHTLIILRFHPWSNEKHPGAAADATAA
jgi:hypothetical protein